MLAQDRLCW